MYQPISPGRGVREFEKSILNESETDDKSNDEQCSAGAARVRRGSEDVLQHAGLLELPTLATMDAPIAMGEGVTKSPGNFTLN